MVNICDLEKEGILQIEAVSSALQDAKTELDRCVEYAHVGPMTSLHLFFVLRSSVQDSFKHVSGQNGTSSRSANGFHVFRDYKNTSSARKTPAKSPEIGAVGNAFVLRSYRKRDSHSLPCCACSGGAPFPAAYVISI